MGKFTSKDKNNSKGGKSFIHKYDVKTSNHEESTNAGYWKGI